MARKMKDSGIEWIGEIPEGWEVLAHKYIMHKEKSICEHYSGEDVISLTLNGVVKRDLENPSGKMPTTFDGYQFVDPNDLLLCLFDIDVTPRCVGLVKDYGVTSPAYSRFKIHSGFCNAYYNYLLRFIDDEKVFVHLSKNLRSSLTESDFGAIKTIVPPKAEQQRIADYLDNRTFEIDTLLSKARSSIEEYKKLKQAVITQAVTKGVRGEREMKDSGVEWIGETPAEWRISRIKYVSIFEPSCDFRKLTPETIITYSPMECIKNGTFERRTSLYGNLAHTLTPFQNGDIVMANVYAIQKGNLETCNWEKIDAIEFRGGTLDALSFSPDSPYEFVGRAIQVIPPQLPLSFSFKYEGLYITVKSGNQSNETYNSTHVELIGRTRYLTLQFSEPISFGEVPVHIEKIKTL